MNKTEYYLYFSPDFKTEYFVEKISTSKLVKIYEEMKNYLQAWVGGKLPSLESILVSNKIIISYPIFDYNRATIDDYPYNLSEHMNMALNYCEWPNNDSLTLLKKYLKTSKGLMHCYIDGTVYNTENEIANVFNNHLKSKLPTMKTGNACIDIKLKTMKDNDLKNYKINHIDTLEDLVDIDLIENYSQLFIMKTDYGYAPFAIEEKNEIICIGDYFNDVSLLKDLLANRYKIDSLIISMVEYFNTRFLNFDQLKLINISDNQYPKYAYIPINNENDFASIYGSIDNEYFPTKSMAILYASKFKNVKISDDSIIPYVNNGLPFDVKSIGFDILSMIQNIDKMYEDMKHKTNSINSLDNHGKAISNSINNVAKANTKIADNLETGLQYIGDVMDHGLTNVANSNIIAAEIGRGWHTLAP